jgi:hypothetical protein
MAVELGNGLRPEPPCPHEDDISAAGEGGVKRYRVHAVVSCEIWETRSHDYSLDSLPQTLRKSWLL